MPPPRITATNSDGYESPAGLAADTVVLTVEHGALAVLLVRRADPPLVGRWALPGGFVGRREDPADTARRKLREKAGVPPVYLEQLRTYAAPGRDPRGWLPSVCHLALVPSSTLPTDPPRDASWTALDTLPRLAFDHDAMVADGVERVRGKLWYSNIALGLLPDAFTAGEAREVYEAVAGVAYDPANFTRDLRASGLVELTGERSAASGPGRPARLYRFVDREPTWGTGYARATASRPAPR